jgi:hypothetical protein
VIVNEKTHPTYSCSRKWGYSTAKVPAVGPTYVTWFDTTRPMLLSPDSTIAGPRNPGATWALLRRCLLGGANVSTPSGVEC